MKKILIKSKKLEEELKRDIEEVHVEYEKLQSKSTHIEVWYEELVEKFKDELFRVMFGQ